MSVLFVLIAVTVGLLALGALARVAPRGVPPLQAAICLIGCAAALSSPGGAVLEAGATFAGDGLSSTMLAALFLLGACGAAGPVGSGAIGLALLAGDAVTLVVLVAAATFTAPAWRFRFVAIGALALALLLFAWHGLIPDPRFAAIRALPPNVLTGGLAIVATLAAAATLPFALAPGRGARVAVYHPAPQRRDRSGPNTPPWWGVPALLLGIAGAVVLARRAAAVDDLATGADAAIQAAFALALSMVGVTLLARGADLPLLAALAVEAALLTVLAAALWGGLLLLASGAIQASVGTTALVRLGGLLRRVPVTGLALLTASLSAAAVPLSAGCAGAWPVLQALLGVGRLGGTALLALSAAAVAATGLVLALLAAAALRFAGASLLGTARSVKAAAMSEPPLFTRLGMATFAAASIVAGLFPALLAAIAQPAVAQLTGAPAEGASVWRLATGSDAQGYAAPLVAVLLAGCTGAAAWLGRGSGSEAPAWRGGLAEDGPARLNTLPLILWPAWRDWRPILSQRHILVGLGLVLAAALGWAAR